jgi:hypothetical protein
MAPGPALGNVNTNLEGNSREQIAAAMELQFRTLGERFQRIMAITDPEVFVQAMEKLDRDLKTLKSDLLADPAAAVPMAGTILSALLNGIAEAKKARVNPRQNN